MSRWVEGWVVAGFKGEWTERQEWKKSFCNASVIHASIDSVVERKQHGYFRRLLACSPPTLADTETLGAWKLSQAKTNRTAVSRSKPTRRVQGA